MKNVETKPKVRKGVVKLMRDIRERLSIEIMDMTYEQERAYLDKLSTAKPAE